MKIIDADDVMERIKQAYKYMGVDTHGVWNKQLAEIFKAEETDVEDVRMCLHKILGAVSQAPSKAKHHMLDSILQTDRKSGFLVARDCRK